jgi:hypothetical protein
MMALERGPFFMARLTGKEFADFMKSKRAAKKKAGADPSGSLVAAASVVGSGGLVSSAASPLPVAENTNVVSGASAGVLTDGIWPAAERTGPHPVSERRED